MAGRARAAPVAACFDLHPKCERVSGAPEGDSGLPPKFDAGMLIFTCHWDQILTKVQNHPTIILSGTASRLHSRGTEDKYVDYVRYLEKSAPHVKRAKEPNTLENYAQGYQDYLQMPLQVG